MFPLIIGILLILLGAFGLGLARRRRSNHRGMAKGNVSVAQAAMFKPRCANGLITLASVLLTIAGLATAFV